MAQESFEKLEAQNEANYLNRNEMERLYYYNQLRSEYTATDENSWLDFLFYEGKAQPLKIKDPGWNEIRKTAGLTIFEGIRATVFKNNEKNDRLAQRYYKVKTDLDEQVASQKKSDEEFRKKHDDILSNKLDEKLEYLRKFDPYEVTDYFSYALSRDIIYFDDTQFQTNFKLDYIPESKRLIVDYIFPNTSQVPRIVEWKVNKELQISPKDMSKSSYLEMYEKLLFDLSVRVVGILFSSDKLNLLEEIVFNGYCYYAEWQNHPSTLLSFVIPKSRYSHDETKKMSWISKAEIAKLKQVEYIGDIKSSKPPAGLLESSPANQIIPIQSSLTY